MYWLEGNLGRTQDFSEMYWIEGNQGRTQDFLDILDGRESVADTGLP